MTIIENKPTYSKFRMELHNHYTIFSELQKELVNVQPFSPSLYKLTEIGELLRIYYIIHSNIDYSNSLYYSFGFEGYMNNLLGLYENLSLENISKAVFDSSSNTLIEGEYYPPHMGLDYVRNNCDLSKNLIITGPNASGKTTYLKTTVVNVIFTQQTGFGFYTSCILNPYTHIHSYLNIPDTSGRDSLFQAESRRCKEILDNIHINNIDSRHLCIFDELYSGTNPEEATKSAYSFLIYLAKNENVDFILTTHYTSICNRMKNTQNIENWKMVVKTKEDDENEIINYTYKIKKGVSKIQGALKVLKEMDYPSEIIESIKKWKED
jgi:DNA mismatch repair ATPase MutS